MIVTLAATMPITQTTYCAIAKTHCSPCILAASTNSHFSVYDIIARRDQFQMSFNYPADIHCARLRFFRCGELPLAA
jgi:hypothetical protein